MRCRPRPPETGCCREATPHPIFPPCRQFSSIPTSRSASPSPRAMRGDGSRGSGRSSIRSLRSHQLSAGHREASGRSADADGAARIASEGAAGTADACRRRPRAGRSTCSSATILAASFAATSATIPTKLERAAGRADAAAAVRQGLSRDHLRPAGLGRTLPGHRAARGQEPWRCGAELFRASRSRSRAWFAWQRRSGANIGSRAACCSSTCRKARRGASGCTRGSIIPIGRMSRSLAGR